jgi:hypothetical protein
VKKTPSRKECAVEAPDVVETEPVVENEAVDSPNNQLIEAVVEAIETGSLFEELESVPEKPSTLEVRPDDIPPLDLGLTKDQKAEFAKLLDAEMPIAERARQLAKLARFTDTKRAPVGLRAIIEINTLCGLREDKPRDDAPLFVMPEDARVAVLIQKVEK